MVNLEEQAKKFDVKTITITMILSSFGFLVALQWRDAIKDTIDALLPPGEGLIYKYVAAILVTILAVVVTFVLVKVKRMDLVPDKYEPHKVLKGKLKKK